MNDPVNNQEQTGVLRDIIFNQPDTGLVYDIGRFVYLYSQLEFLLKTLVADSLRLADDRFDLVMTGYDFGVLCAVTQEILLTDRQRDLRVHRSPEKYDQMVRNFIGSCRSINQTRIKIVHGTWTSIKGTRHASRGKLIAEYVFKEPNSLQTFIEKLEGLIATTMGLISRDALKYTDETP